MGNMIRSFRFRMLLLFVFSLAASGLVTYGIYRVLKNYYYEHARFGDNAARLRAILYDVGDLNAFLILFVPLAILFYFLFSRPYVSYFTKISQGIGRLASGDFSSTVVVRSGDEFQRIAEDINRASDQLRNAIERGEFAESSKDQLVLNLAHDLRTPLTSVLGYLDYVLHNDQLTPEQARHYTTIALAKSRRLEKLIEELFDITRMNYGNLPVEREPIDLAGLLGQLAEELYPLFENAGLAVRLDVPPQAMIVADGDKLARVFENLLTNAARYGKDGQFIDVRCEMEGGEAVVQVINYGQAIPEAELPFVFEMFYTGNKARTAGEGSTGLGLYIAKNIVERHGGTISVQSSVIRTAFVVRLPVAEPAA